VDAGTSDNFDYIAGDSEGGFVINNMIMLRDDGAIPITMVHAGRKCAFILPTGDITYPPFGLWCAWLIL